ncbi:MAG: hypothetical protein U0176_26760 [Bacteroidia bacterium]
MIDDPSSNLDFFPSTLEHRPLHTPEKVELKKYFAESGENEGEGYKASPYAITPELENLEKWVWGLRLWGRECLVKAGVAAVTLLNEAWERNLENAGDDPVPLAAAHGDILNPAEGISTAKYWADIPSEEKAIRVSERVKPLHEAWMEPQIYTKLAARPFIWGGIGALRLVEAVLIKRDPAAKGVAEAACGAARVRMMAGESAEKAAEAVKAKIILDLRTWMGYKW